MKTETLFKFGKLALGLGVLALSLIGARMLRQHMNKAEYTFGILKTISHPALDLVEQGFIEVVKGKLGDKVAFVCQSADGAPLHATHIAQNFHSNNAMTAMLAIATPAAIALYKAEQTRPVIIAAVTDPVSLGLLDKTTNICGVSDMIAIDGEIDMLIKLLPNAQRIGLLLNPSEPNSRVVADLMNIALQMRRKSVKIIELQSENEIVPTINSAVTHVDVLLAPTDNMVASSIATIAACARKAHIPLIVSDNALVSAGALAARGVDYKEVGMVAGEIALAVTLNGAKPDQLPIKTCKSEKIYLNKAVATELNIIVPAELEPMIVWINGK